MKEGPKNPRGAIVEARLDRKTGKVVLCGRAHCPGRLAELRAMDLTANLGASDEIMICLPPDFVFDRKDRVWRASSHSLQSRWYRGIPRLRREQKPEVMVVTDAQADRGPGLRLMPQADRPFGPRPVDLPEFLVECPIRGCGALNRVAYTRLGLRV